MESIAGIEDLLQWLPFNCDGKNEAGKQGGLSPQSAWEMFGMISTKLEKSQTLEAVGRHQCIIACIQSWQII